LAGNYKTENKKVKNNQNRNIEQPLYVSGTVCKKLSCYIILV